MNSITIAALLLVSFAALALSDTGAYYYAPEYKEYENVESTGVRGKRHVDPASLAFLVGVGAGGIFGPILYNRLYGWKPAKIVQTGWEEPVSQGWQEPEPQGWSAPAKGGY